jgi:hypothetical protein
MPAVSAIQPNLLTMSNLLTRLGRVGLKADFVRRFALPHWWDNSLESDETAMLEAAGYIAKRMGLNIASVFNPNSDIQFKDFNQTKFKKQQATDEQSWHVSQGLANRVAELVSYSVKVDYCQPVVDPQHVRQEILSQNKQVDLPALLDFCWSHGIPVIHFSTFPEGSRKMDGMVTWLNDRPVIVVSCNRKHLAWLLFILAHELGHILLGHVQSHMLVDAKISQEAEDPEEKEANGFAEELVLGSHSRYKWDGKYSGQALAQRARAIAIRDKVDPAAICLNYAWSQKDWGGGISALKEIEQNDDGIQVINRYLARHLDWDCLDRDSQEYLRLVTGV